VAVSVALNSRRGVCRLRTSERCEFALPLQRCIRQGIGPSGRPAGVRGIRHRGQLVPARRDPHAGGTVVWGQSRGQRCV